MSCTFYFTLSFFPWNNLLCKNLFGLHNWSLGLHKTDEHMLSVSYKWKKSWSLNNVKLWACACLPQDHSLWAELFLKPVGVSWCLCSHLLCPLPGAAEGFLMGRLAAPPGREPSGCLPFSLLRSSWDLRGFQGWLFCSPADIPWVGRPFQP